MSAVSLKNSRSGSTSDVSWRSWASAAGDDINHRLGPVIGGSVAARYAIEMAVDAPNIDACRSNLSGNSELLGVVSLRRQSATDNPVTIRIPLPYAGILAAHRSTAIEGLLLTWGAWLGEAPGFRLVHPTSLGRRGIVEWRVGLPGGYFVGAPCGELSSSDHDRLMKLPARFMCPANVYPEWLRDAVGNLGPCGVSKPKRVGNAWLEIHERIMEQFMPGQIQVTDQDDLDHRILVTFPVWLRSRLCDELLRAIKGMPDRELAAEAIHVLFAGEALDENRAAKVWEYLVGAADTIARRLVPLRRTWINDRERVDRACGLHVVDPANPVDLAARLTRVTRFRTSGHALDEIPAEFRQNHPSFRGRLCPVESPESELVGLTLQLAQGATVDLDGRIHPGPSDAPINELGFGAGLIPFLQHNDGARNMMGAKNLRQALPVVGRKAPAVKSGGEISVMNLTRPLAELGLCRNAVDNRGELALGVDLLVAYLPWNGMNFEDAIVVGKHLVDSGAMDVAVTTRIHRTLKAGWEPRSPDWASVLLGEVGGLARKGERLSAGSLIASLSVGGGVKPYVIRYTDRSPAMLKSIAFSRPNDWTGGTLTYELEKRIPLGLGDKLMGRHGNKGVVGAVVPVEEMPCLPDIPALPKALRGRRIDLLLNPHGVISRMNAGQLLETHIGWLLHAGACSESDLRSQGASDGNPIGYPFGADIDHDKVRAFLEKSGLDATGRIQLVLSSGQKTLSPVVVGFQHIVRLRHIPELKAQARRGGAGAVYAQKTGQAVHGRTRGGGQRIGEMEVWALAGHRAEYILEEMLGGKADAGWAAKWLGETPPQGDLSNGFPALLHDWLFALLVKAEAKSGELTLSFAPPKAVVARIGADHRVETGAGLRKLTTAAFCCHAGKASSRCDYSLSNYGRIAVRASAAKDEHISSLRLGELLAHIGLAIEGPVLANGKIYKCRLRSVATQDAAGYLLSEFTLVRDQLKAVIRPGEKKERPPGWPDALNEVYAYGRFADSEAGKNIEASELLKELRDPIGKHQIGDLRITCPRHKTVPLKASPPYGETLRADPRGLFDTAVFGSLWAAAAGSWSKRNWGYIELPVEVRYPLHVFLSAADSGGGQANAATKKKVQGLLAELGLKDKTVPRIRMVPVLPSHYRMPLLMLGDPLDDPLVKHGYRPIIEKCRQYQDAKSKDDQRHLARQIEDCVANLFSLLVGGLRGKTGLIRREGLGRRVDRSGRLVVVPNPGLKWDQVGVPAAVLLELMGDRIRLWLDKCGRSKDLLDVIRASQARQDKTLDLDTWSWWRSSKDEELILRAKRLLDEYLTEHPDVLVLVNRQPSLHRDSFQAFHPLALGPEAGDSLQLCPLACKGLAADFDGDEMVVHLPVSKAAQDEAKRLLPSKNLFSLASGEVMAHFDQDFVMGSYWINEADRDLKNRFRAALPADCCRALVGTGRIGKKEGAQLLGHLAHEHPEKAPDAIWAWMNAAFECCTRVGVSFGFYDLVDIKKRVKVPASVFAVTPQNLDPEKTINGVIQACVEKALGDTLAGPVDWARPGLHFAAMALSGARGRKQTRQVVGARGFLSPGATAFEISLSDFVLRSSLVDGMNSDEAFWAAMNSRSSMCDKKLGTGHAGDLTRQLVFALWPFTITRKDCKTRSTERTALTCKAKAGCCALCYGTLPDGTLPEIGFPVGLIAAQSIGERGTQLSMQSFHTGQRAFTIGDARRIVGHGDDQGYFTDLAGASQFVAALKACDAYSSLLDRHFHILWRVIRTSPKHSIRSAIAQLGPLSRMAFQNQAREILTSALSRQPSSLAEPAARVLYGLFGARQKLAAKD